MRIIETLRAIDQLREAQTLAKLVVRFSVLEELLNIRVPRIVETESFAVDRVAKPGLIINELVGKKMQLAIMHSLMIIDLLNLRLAFDLSRVGVYLYCVHLKVARFELFVLSSFFFHHRLLLRRTSVLLLCAHPVQTLHDSSERREHQVSSGSAFAAALPCDVVRAYRSSMAIELFALAHKALYITRVYVFWRRRQFFTCFCRA